MICCKIRSVSKILGYGKTYQGTNQGVSVQCFGIIEPCNSNSIYENNDSVPVQGDNHDGYKCNRYGNKYPFQAWMFQLQNIHQ